MQNIIEITDFMAPELDVYARLSEAQLLHYREPHTGVFIAESPLVVERALDAGYQPMSILIERKQLESSAGEIVMRCGTIPIFTSDEETLTRLTGFHLTRGMLCAMYRKELPTVEEICRNATRIAVLEDVVNPTNMGAIFRSAAALNMDTVLLSSACTNPFYRRSIRVSMGTVFQIPWTIMNSTDEWTGVDITSLQKLGFRTAAMALSKESINIDHPDLMREPKLAIVLGTEGEGLRKETISACDYTVCIPMSHGVDSLNVAAASAVAFWQLGNRK